MLSYSGKQKYAVDPKNLEGYDEVHFDLLWYLMDTCKITRYATKGSFREFLIRFFLIRDKPFDSYALDIIDEELIVDGFLNDTYFSLRVQDLVALLGYAASTARYNIYGTLDKFIASYSYSPPNIKFSESEEEENTYKVSRDALKYMFMGLGNLLHIHGCTLRFKPHLQDLTPEQLQGATRLADFVVGRLPDQLFERYQVDFPFIFEGNFERYSPADSISFDLYREVAPENLAVIFETIANQSIADEFRREGPTEDFRVDMEWYEEHIKFAYGVKHGYIKLSTEYDSLITELDPRYDLEFELLQGPDEELYTTQDIYEMWSMAEWIHLLP